MDANPISAAKSALNVHFLIKLLLAFWALAILAGLLGVWDWFINPWAVLKVKFPALANIGRNP